MTDSKKRIAEIVAAAAPPPPLEVIAAEQDKPRPKKRGSRRVEGLTVAAAVPKQKKKGARDEAQTSSGDSGPGIEWAPENDVGNAQRLLHHFGADLLYVHGIGWHIWQGCHWKLEGADQEAKRLAQKTASRIKQEKPLTHQEAEIKAKAEEAAKTEAGSRSAEQRTALVEWAELGAALEKTTAPKGRWAKRASFSVSSGNSGKIKGMLEQAEPHKLVMAAGLDRDPLAFNVENGTLRFFQERDDEDPSDGVARLVWRVRLDAHARDDLISKVAPARYDPSVKCPQWDAFLSRVQPEARVRRFLQAWYGYSMTGLTDAQAFVFNWGGGANGKSTFAEAIFRLLGPYGGSLNPESFTGAQQRRGDQATPDLAALTGVRALRIAELPERARLQDNLVKAVTGGEPIMVRHLNQPFFKFHPKFKPSMGGNAKPNTDDISEGFWRRLFLVPWTITIPADERLSFEEMQTTFEAERSGILNWLIEGALAYLGTRKLEPPEEVVAATAEHREEMDPVGQFIRACVEREEGAQVTGGKLYGVYLSWCDDSGLKPISLTMFGRTVPKHGFLKVRGAVVNYLDMRLRPEAPPPRAPTKKDFG